MTHALALEQKLPPGVAIQATALHSGRWAALPNHFCWRNQSIEAPTPFQRAYQLCVPT